MRTHGRVLPRVTGVVLAAATVFGALPKPAEADAPRREAAVAPEVKTPKKRKRSTAKDSPIVGMHWGHGPRWGRWTIPQHSPASIAVSAARAQIGKPYRWGATGPSGFDCSGLTRFAWAAAGVHLPHSSRAQFASLKRVPLDEAKPGDLIYSPGHVGIYIGKGQMIHAPHSGARVQIDPIHGNTVGAVRPD